MVKEKGIRAGLGAGMMAWKSWSRDGAKIKGQDPAPREISEQDPDGPS